MVDFDLVPSLMSKREKQLLYETARATDGDAVEVGSWMGGSTIIIATGLKNGKVYAIDPHKDTTSHRAGKVEDTFRIFKKNIKNFGVDNKIIPVHKTSKEAFDSWEGKKVGMLFIDGDHSYSGVRYDIESWMRFLKSNGFLVFHDLFGGGNDGVRKAVLDTKIVDKMRYLKRKGRLAVFVNDGKTKLKGRLTVRYASGIKRFFWYITQAMRPRVWKKYILKMNI